MCGEKKVMKSGKDKQLGSPPHVRGKVPAIFLPVSTHRITPACAGKSWYAPFRYSMTWDHPRMCGEKYHEKNLPERTKGSPPHVRGKVMLDADGLPQVGITPACAGKSLRCFS